jgi:hypothetical protein
MKNFKYNKFLNIQGLFKTNFFYEPKKCHKKNFCKKKFYLNHIIYLKNNKQNLL